MTSIERCGISADGIYHNTRAADITKFTAKIDRLFDRHPHSVGVGTLHSAFEYNLTAPCEGHPATP